MGSDGQQERESAKQSISARQEQDPELDNALNDAQEYQLRITRETNRHDEAMLKTRLGKIGGLIGGEGAAPTGIAFFVVFCGVAMAAFGLLVAANSPTEQEFWVKQTERGIALTSAAMAYLFGRGSK